MISETWLVVTVLAVATFGIRLSGILLGQSLPVTGPWARGLNALPGCIIIALVSELVFSSGPDEWVAGAVASVVTLVTRNLPLTMAAGILCVFVLRQF